MSVPQYSSTSPTILARSRPEPTPTSSTRRGANRSTCATAASRHSRICSSGIGSPSYTDFHSWKSSPHASSPESA
nr:hypothetical protein [Streptomyces phaeoluteigriseus]